MREQDFGNYKEAELAEAEVSEADRFGRFFYRFPQIRPCELDRMSTIPREPGPVNLTVRHTHPPGTRPVNLTVRHPPPRARLRELDRTSPTPRARPP